MFEIKKCDLAGRIGILHTNHGIVQTPAYVPVIHPFKQTIPTKKFRQIGFDLVITNAYLTKKHYGTEESARRGIHNIINFDGAIMTDSGGYQVLEYGNVEVSPSEIASFESKIGADIAIPLDKPTGLGLPKRKAEAFVDHTLKVSKKTLQQKPDNGQIWVGPIQGGEHFGLIKKSAKALVGYGFEMLALGSPVEVMESYQYKLLANMIIAAKKHVPSSIPFHLFGAGHPLTIPLAVALGCDTFDSASYILYAKKDRYITEDGTRRLEDITYFSCICQVCSKFKPKELSSLENKQKVDKLALHNLFAIKAEVDRVKESIFEGRLWEYVIKKSRAHPKLFETIEVLTKNSESFFIKSTPKFKSKAIFLYSKEDQYRPEVLSFHQIIRKFRTKKKILVISEDATNFKPAYLSKQYTQLSKRFDPNQTQFCLYNPFLGLIPIELSDMYPAAHYLMTKSFHLPQEFPVFATTWKIFFEKNAFEKVYLNKDDGFICFFSKTLPKTIAKKSL